MGRCCQWQRRCGLGFVGLVLVLNTGAVAPVTQVKREQVRPGLVATYRDAGGPGAVAIVQLEPTVALSLQPGEAPHPRLSAEGGTVVWEGYVNVLRAGDYQFSALLRGKIQLTVNGKELLRGEAAGKEAEFLHGPQIRLEPGLQPLRAEFTRLPGIARLELSWKAGHFSREPLPYSVLRHLSEKAEARLKRTHSLERGRFVVEESGCLNCHKPAANDRMAAGLVTRKGPDLSNIGQRVKGDWLYHWLTTEHAAMARSMPLPFSNDDAGRVEAYAVTRFLEALGGPLKVTGKPGGMQDLAGSVKRGRLLFTMTGCIACHEPTEGKKAENPDHFSVYQVAGSGGTRIVPLAPRGGKTTPEKLAEYLLNPLAHDPASRMPRMLLNGKEALDIARYLTFGLEGAAMPKLPPEPSADDRLAAFKRGGAEAKGVETFQRLPAERQWQELGCRLAQQRGCVSCHTIAPGGKAIDISLKAASYDTIKNQKTHTNGCLAPDGARRGQAPRYLLGQDDLSAVRAFLAEGTRGAGSSSPVHAARIALLRFNCLACHQRDGEGGLSIELVEQLRKYEKAENAEAVTPPSLTGAGHKLRTSWLRKVLLEGERARPWMALRMPQFGSANVGQLPEALAALDGTVPDDRIHQAPLSETYLQMGRHLVGKSGFGCISCHDIAGFAGGGTRGPDLAHMTQRVRYDWYRRWLEAAQRMEPGTKMPTVFPEGKSIDEKVLDGKADAQAQAMWAYLAIGPTLQLPEGVVPPKGLVLAVKDRPVLLRTFMPEAGTRSVAIGFPGEISTVFDCGNCRLAYAWAGPFLDASPVWDNRGGAPAKVLGPKIWTAPAGCPLAVTDSNTPPDFAALARDPAYGGPVPEGQVFKGQPRLFFNGYMLNREGVPIFRYRLESAGKPPLEVLETPWRLRSSASAGIARIFNLLIPPDRTVWLNIGEAVELPRVLNEKGKPLEIDLKKPITELPAPGHHLVLRQGGGKLILVTPQAAPAGSIWHIQQQGGTWRVLLRLRPPVQFVPEQIALYFWAPGRDDSALLEKLITQP